MKTVCKKLFSLLLVAVLLVSAIPFQASAALGDPVKVYFLLEGETTSFTTPVTGFLGYALGVMIPNSYIVTTQYNAKHSDGKLFTNKWTLNSSTGPVVTGSTVLSEDMLNSDGAIVLVADFEYPEVTVTFNANGGKVDPTSKSYKKQDLYGTLPTPTRDGYIFSGWYTNINDESTRITAGLPVPGNVTLYAKWETGSLPIVFQKWDATNEKWIEADRSNANTGKSMRDSGKSLPDVTAYDNRLGYKVDKDYPWVDANGNVFTVDTVINAVTYVRPNYKANEYTITYNYNSSDKSNKTQKVAYGSKLTLDKPSHNDYVFMGWVYVPDNDKEVKDGDTYVWTSDITLTAVWAKKGTVELRVYRDDADGFKTYYYHGAILGDELNLNNCKIENYLRGDYKFDGWFDKINFDRYLAAVRLNDHETTLNNITRLDSVKTTNEESSVTVIYGMVKGYKATTGNNVTNNNNSVNTGTADPTNPKTGDTIMIAVATMTMAAAALVAMYELKKRKMI